MSTAVPHQVELHIAATAVELKIPLTLAIRGIPAPLHDGQIGLQEGIAHRLQHGKAAFKAELREIVEEYAADAALLVTVFQIEVLVAPFLEARVQIGAVRRNRIVAGLVKMHRVFLERVERRQVHATAKPERWRFACVARRDHAHIHVHRGHPGVAGVEYQRHAHGRERSACQLRPVLRG
ncbi:hypothetical protein D3C72_1625640 [compost metagenome]